MSVFADQLKNSAADMDGMAAWLDSLDHETRVKEVRSLAPLRKGSGYSPNHQG